MSPASERGKTRHRQEEKGSALDKGQKSARGHVISFGFDQYVLAQSVLASFMFCLSFVCGFFLVLYDRSGSESCKGTQNVPSRTGPLTLRTMLRVLSWTNVTRT
jgi:hypothetical protein